ncbi:MAG: hypothetical protein IT338_09640 [Thermomicrobiales bacterium]|nr:hypothetical protein [Thermomicrobiales bacterium]
MLTNHKTVTILPDSPLDQVLKAAEASGEPVVIDTGDDRYAIRVTRLEANGEPFAGYDPEKAVAGLRALGDALAGVDREALLHNLREQHEQRGRGRPTHSTMEQHYVAVASS